MALSTQRSLKPVGSLLGGWHGKNREERGFGEEERKCAEAQR